MTIRKFRTQKEKELYDHIEENRIDDSPQEKNKMNGLNEVESENFS